MPIYFVPLIGHLLLQVGIAIRTPLKRGPFIMRGNPAVLAGFPSAVERGGNSVFEFSPLSRARHFHSVARAFFSLASAADLPPCTAPPGAARRRCSPDHPDARRSSPDNPPASHARRCVGAAIPPRPSAP